MLDGEFTRGSEVDGAAADISGMFALYAKLKKGRLGPMNRFIYARAAAQVAAGRETSFHHAAIAGSNGVYRTKAPYDLVVGNGTPDVRKLLEITDLPAAGIPGSASNP